MLPHSFTLAQLYLYVRKLETQVHSHIVPFNFLMFLTVHQKCSNVGFFALKWYNPQSNSFVAFVQSDVGRTLEELGLTNLATLYVVQGFSFVTRVLFHMAYESSILDQ